MEIPLFSIFSLVTEVFVTAAVFYIIYRGYHDGIFMRGFAYLILGYELLFNITYMLSRAIRHVPEHSAHQHDAFTLSLAIFHGIFSPIMFAALIAFFLIASRAYARGENYFQLHSTLTTSFVVAWLLSIFSGILFFFVLYI